MASTYVNNLRLEEIGSGEQSGTWGDTTNTNLEIIGQAVAWGTRAIADASTDNITIADGALDADRCLGLKLTGGGQACTVTLLPNTSSKTWFMYNATAAALTFTCGSGANVIIPAGQTKVIATDGLGSGGVVHDLLTEVNFAGDVFVTNTLNVAGDTAAGDAAAIGYTAALGIIVTGQGSTNDITLVNDADATVLSVPTGTTNVDIVGVATAATFEPDGDTAAGDNAAIGYTAAEGLILTGQGSTSDITLKNDNDDVVFTVPTGTDSVLFPDNHRAMFGDSSDLQIWHDSSDGHSYISDLGTGNLALTTNGTAIALQKGETENLAVFTVDGAVTLYHDNAAKLATASGGVTVTGEMAATTMDLSSNAVIDGTALVTGVLTANGGVVFNEGSADVDFRVESNGATNALLVDGGNNHVNIMTSTDLGAVLNVSGNAYIQHADNSDTLTLESTDADANAGPNLMLYRSSANPADNDRIASITYRGRNDNNQDVDYIVYDSFITDASDGAESGELDIRTMVAGAETTRILLDPAETVFNEASADLDFRVESNGNANMLFVDGGNDRVGVSTSSPNALLHVGGTAETQGDATNPAIQVGSTTGYRLGMYTDSEGGYIENKNGDNGLIFRVKTAGEAMRINGGTGSVGIGVADGDVTSDGNSSRTYVGIIGAGNRGRLNIGSTASNGADGGAISFLNGTNELGALYNDASSGSQTTGTMFFTANGKIDIRASDEVVFNQDSADVDFRVETDGNANMIFVDGGNDVVTIGGTTGETGDTFSVTNATNAINTRFVSTNDDANGVRLVLQKASTGPANNDEVAEIDFIGKDSAGNDEVYGFIQCFIDDVTSGTEDGILRFSTVTAATSRNRLDILPNETVFNEEGVGGINFRIETLNSTHALFVEGSSNNVLIGVGAESPLGKLHVKTADSAASAHANADEIVAESNNDAGISILSGQSYKGSLFFGDAGLNSDGRIEYSQGTRSMTLATAGTDAVIISSSGEMTKPLQPAFLAQPASTQNNFDADGSNDTVVFGTERFDVGANFASNTFTAPVTGKYQLSVNLYLTDLDSAANYYQATLITSNRNYFYAYDVSSTDSDPNRFTFQINALVDMDASDTASVGILQSGGTAQTDINVESFFSGFLAC